MAKQGTKALSWLMALALLVSVIAPFAVRPQSAQAVVSAVAVTVDAQVAATAGVPNGALITVVWQTSLDYAGGQTYLINFPAGVTVPAATVVPANTLAGNGASAAAAIGAMVPVVTGTVVAVGQTVTITGAAGFDPPAGGFVAFQFTAAAGITTAAQGYVPAPITAAAGAPIAELAVASALPLVFNASFTPTPVTVNQSAQYVVNVIARTALISGVDTLTITFPNGVVLPSTIAKALISVAVNGGASNPLNVDPVVGSSVTLGGTANTRNVQLTLPNLTPANAAIVNIAAQAPGVPSIVTITIGQTAGVKNPAVGGPAGAAASTTGTAGTVTASAAGFPQLNNLSRVNFGRTLTHSATSGVRGANITSTAEGLVSGSAATLFIDNGAGLGGANDGIRNGTEPLLGTASVGTDGKASITWVANVPPLLAGANNFGAAGAPTIIDNSGLTNLGASPFANFTVNRSVTLSQTTGTLGTAITLTGQDFTAGEALDGPDADAFAQDGITIAGLNCGPVAPAAVAAAVGGTLPATALCTVPAGTPAGVATVRVWTPANLNAAGATATFTVQGATISLAPNTGVPGTPVAISASGLTASVAGAAIPPACAAVATSSCVPVGGIALGVAANPTAIAIDATGNMPATTINIAAAQGAGTIQVTVIDAAGFTGTANLIIPVREITVTPTTSPRGSTVSVTGKGYTRNTGVTVNYAGAGITGGTTDGSGNFAINFTVPQTAGINSTNVVAGVDNGAPGLPTNQNAVVHNVPGTGITVTPATSPMGANVTIAGTGFPQFTQVTVLTIGGLNVLPAAGINTDTSGNFTATALVPAQNAGAAAVTATAGGVSGTATITINTAAATVSSQMQPIAAILVRVWAYDNASNSWKLYDPAAPAAANTLASILKAQAVNIVTNAAGTLTNAGGTYPLKSGNNLYGWQGP